MEKGKDKPAFGSPLPIFLSKWFSVSVKSSHVLKEFRVLDGRAMVDHYSLSLQISWDAPAQNKLFSW